MADTSDKVYDTPTGVVPAAKTATSVVVEEDAHLLTELLVPSLLPDQYLSALPVVDALQLYVLLVTPEPGVFPFTSK